MDLQNNPNQFNPVDNPNQPVQTVPSPAPNATSQPMATASVGWFSGGKLIAIIAVIVLVLGAGVYFAFFAKTPQSTSKQSNSTGSANQAVPNQTSGNLGTNSMAPASGNNQNSNLTTNQSISSTTVGNLDDHSPFPFGCKDLISGAFSQTTFASTGAIICTSQSGGVPSFVVNHMTDADKLIFGDSYSTFMNKTNKIVGVGYEAIYQTEDIIVRIDMISSNQKYFVTVNSELPVQKSLDVGVPMLKTIDTNLNKY